MRRAPAIVLMTVFGVASLTACGGDDGTTKTASPTTTVAPAGTGGTGGSGSTGGATTTVDVGEPICLTADEVGAIAGTVPDSVEAKPSPITGWPTGQCEYSWTSLGSLLSLDVTRDAKDAQGRFDSSVSSVSKQSLGQETELSVDLGDESYAYRDKYATDGFDGTILLHKGDFYMNAYFNDEDGKLRPGTDAGYELLQAMVVAQLAKL